MPTLPAVFLVDELVSVLDQVRVGLRTVGRDIPVLTGSLREVPENDTCVVLYDMPASGSNGIDNVERHVRRSRAPVAVFTASPSIESAIDAFRSGARGYLSKLAAPQQLGTDLTHLLAGRSAMDAALGGELAIAIARNPAASWPGMAFGLTRREGEVLALLRRGLTNREIAERLIIGMQTVKTHAHAVYHKLGVSSRSELNG